MYKKLVFSIFIMVSCGYAMDEEVVKFDLGSSLDSQDDRYASPLTVIVALTPPTPERKKRSNSHDAFDDQVIQLMLPENDDFALDAPCKDEISAEFGPHVNISPFASSLKKKRLYNSLVKNGLDGIYDGKYALPRRELRKHLNQTDVQEIVDLEKEYMRMLRGNTFSWHLMQMRQFINFKKRYAGFKK